MAVLLPLAAAHKRTPPRLPSAQPVVPADTRHTLLVIDDESDVRQVTARMLERLGYHAVTAADGKAGLALLNAEHRIAGVLLDLTMPGLSGEETFQQLRQCRPGLPVIVVSGYSEQEVRSRFGTAESIDVVQKPFTASTLRAVLARLLAVSARRRYGRRARACRIAVAVWRLACRSRCTTGGC